MAKSKAAPVAPATAGPGRDLDQKYRPRRLEDVAGQEAAVATIRAWGGKIPRCILLHGGPGCGKTTAARILAEELDIRGRDLKETNCGILESPIEFVRDIEARMNMSAFKTGGKKAWILDEAQTFSRQKGAQEALLKVLEDCPDDVHFFLCTTDPKRILEPVRSRCTPVAIKALTELALTELLSSVAAAEGIQLDPDVAEALVASAAGSARVAIKSLEMVAGLPADDALRALGGGYGDGSPAFDLVKAVLPFSGDGTWAATAPVLKKLEDEDPEGLRQMLLSCARGQLLKGGKGAKAAAKLILALEKPLYDRNSGKALLAAYLYHDFFGAN